MRSRLSTVGGSETWWPRIRDTKGQGSPGGFLKEVSPESAWGQRTQEGPEGGKAEWRPHNTMKWPLACSLQGIAETGEAVLGPRWGTGSASRHVHPGSGSCAVAPGLSGASGPLVKSLTALPQASFRPQRKELISSLSLFGLFPVTHS